MPVSSGEANRKSESAGAATEHRSNKERTMRQAKLVFIRQARRAGNITCRISSRNHCAVGYRRLITEQHGKAESRLPDLLHQAFNRGLHSAGRPGDAYRGNGLTGAVQNRRGNAEDAFRILVIADRISLVLYFGELERKLRFVGNGHGGQLRKPSKGEDGLDLSRLQMRQNTLSERRAV